MKQLEEMKNNVYYTLHLISSVSGKELYDTEVKNYTNVVLGRERVFYYLYDNMRLVDKHQLMSFINNHDFDKSCLYVYDKVLPNCSLCIVSKNDSKAEQITKVGFYLSKVEQTCIEVLKY